MKVRTGRNPFAAFWFAFAVVFLLVFTNIVIVTFLLPETYASTARIKVESGSTNDAFTTGGQSDNRQTYDSLFLQTTFEAIESQAVLTNVVSTLDLNAKWGKKHNGGKPLKTADCVKLLKQRLLLQPVRNPKLIFITVYDEDRQEAADLANGVAKAYQDYKLGSCPQLNVAGLNRLKKQLTEVQSKIRIAQTNVEYLQTKLNLNYIFDNQPHTCLPGLPFSDQMLQAFNQQLLAGQRTYQSLSNQFVALKALDQDHLRFALPGVTGDQSLAELVQKLGAAEQTLATITNDYPLPGAPGVVRLQSKINELQREVDERDAAIMATLASELKSKQTALTSLQDSIELAKAMNEREQARTQPYWDAKRELDNLLEFQKQLVFKIEMPSLDLSISSECLVTITDYAQPGNAPAKPNKRLNLALGAIAGILLGSVAGILAALLAQRRIRHQS